MAAAAAAALGVAPTTSSPRRRAPSGTPLPVDRIRAAVPALIASLGEDVGPAARGDPGPPTCAPSSPCATSNRRPPGQLAAIAKGSGMIHPQMATMFSS